MPFLKVNLSLFFNQSCNLCQQQSAEPTGLCADCHADLPWLIHACRICAEPLPSDVTATTLCVHCLQQRPSFDRVLAPLHYRFPLTELLPGIKYQRRPAELGWLSATLAHWLRDQLETPPACLLPVPMHPLSLSQRGFNQAALIATALSSQLQIPNQQRLLRKIRRTHHQAELGRRQRLANLRGSFQCRGPVPAHVALIDDVMTTGSTAQELAQVLRSAGAKRVEVWVLARTPA